MAARDGRQVRYCRTFLIELTQVREKRRYARLLRLPNRAQNRRLVQVTAATNWRESACGTWVCTSSSWGAPTTWGSASRQTAIVAIKGDRLKNSSPSPAAVDAAVAIHQSWRAPSSAAGTPGKVGGRPRPGAIVKITNPASPHSRPSYQSIGPRSANIPHRTSAKPTAVRTLATAVNAV